MRFDALLKALGAGRGAGRIHTLTLVLTDRCNLRCRMCDIWEKAPERRMELGLDAIEEVLRARCVQDLRAVNLTGGEPFLREDLPEICAAVRRRHPGCLCTISSNGTRTDAVLRFLAQAGRHEKIILELSVLGAGVHDEVTRCPGSLRALELTASEVRRRFPALRVKVKFVVTPWNHGDIGLVADYCARHGLTLLIKLIENSISYTNTLRYEENLRSGAFGFSDDQRREILRRLRKPDIAAVADKAALEGAITFLDRGQVHQPCRVAAESLFISSNGDAYRCCFCDSIGNVNGCGLDPLFFPSARGGGRHDGTSDACGRCVSINRFLTGVGMQEGR
jgi:Fe-coproporphyrin III synthase